MKVTPKEPCVTDAGAPSPSVFVYLRQPDTDRYVVAEDTQAAKDGRWGPFTVAVPGTAPTGLYDVVVSCATVEGFHRGISMPYKETQVTVSAYLPDPGSVSQGEQASSCSRPFLVGLRGSGEKREDSQTGAGMGKVIDDLHSDLVRAVGPIDVVSYDDQGKYPASSITQPHLMLESAVRGQILAQSQVANRIRKCGANTKILMAGYSQGALAVQNALTTMLPSQRKTVVGVVLFGNPQYTWGVNGAVGPATSGILGARAVLPGGLPSRMQDYCLAKDPVCAAGTDFFRFSTIKKCVQLAAECTHFNYGITAKTRAVPYLADRIKQIGR